VATGVVFGGGAAPAFLAGPCVIESESHALKMAEILRAIAARTGIALVYKSSFDKANRSSGSSYRGPGLEEGLRILEKVRKETGLALVTDVHSPEQATAAGEVVDLLQIPAFLCRQTDLLFAAYGTGRAVNVKKGQFLSAAEAKNIVEKAEECGTDKVLLTERGTTFGYNDLVVDMRSLPLMRAHGAPVLLDVTHGLQRPGAGGTVSGGTPELAEPLARAGAGAGVDGFFLEVHDDPPRAKSDAGTQITAEVFERIVSQVLRIDEVARESERSRS
jgi:2-dehydro-3-deoxyphosphooctonate aldolase (KDO 8-P synthase)